jgi:hypothetical protein
LLGTLWLLLLLLFMVFRGNMLRFGWCHRTYLGTITSE